MQLGRLNHVGVATPSIENSLALYRNHVRRRAAWASRSTCPRRACACALSIRPIAQIELIEPLGADSPIVKFLEKNPLGGQHHVCFEVPDIHAAKAEFEAKGARVLGEPRIGAHGTLVFFVHPKDMGGVLTEIMETPKLTSPLPSAGEGNARATGRATASPAPLSSVASLPLRSPARGERLLEKCA